MSPTRTVQADSPEARAALAEVYGSKGRRKYHNEPVERDGYRFDSKAEARRYEELRRLQMAGEISDLTVHPKWEFVVDGVKVGTYTADFSYMPKDKSEWRIEDVKQPSTRTAVYRLKKRLMRALYGLDVVEVGG